MLIVPLRGMIQTLLFEGHRNQFTGKKGEQGPEKTGFTCGHCCPELTWRIFYVLCRQVTLASCLCWKATGPGHQVVTPDTHQTVIIRYYLFFCTYSFLYNKYARLGQVKEIQHWTHTHGHSYHRPFITYYYITLKTPVYSVIQCHQAYTGANSSSAIWLSISTNYT